MNLRSLVYRHQPIARARRMRQFAERLGVRAGQRVLDLGGTTEIWSGLDIPLDITIVNLPGIEVDRTQHGPHRFTFIAGDATAMPDYADGSFDIVHSNSVIEHVGGPAKEAAFAREVRRIGRAYHVQTPSIHFPLEAHTGVPFWWRVPAPLRRAILTRWKRKLPAFTEMIEGTTVIGKRTLSRYFPDAVIETERVLGIPKSYTAWRAAR